MKTTLLLPVLLLLGLSGCALNDFVQKQQEWNGRNGMGSMNAGVSIPNGHADSAPNAAEPSTPPFSEQPPSAMHCSGASASASAGNAGSFSSSTSCHN
jgi:hypothetical protein